MADDEPKVVPFVPRVVVENQPPDIDKEYVKDREVWPCDCNSRRFYLTVEGPECVYCGALALDWIAKWSEA